MDRRLIDRLLEVQPSRPDLTQAQRRMQLERMLDWLAALSVTAGRVGFRFEWRLSPMPVRWRVDDRGAAFRLQDYISPHGWVPLGQLYGVPPPTDEPLADAQGVYPPYEVDRQYVAWVARTVRTWRRFRESQGRLARRRAQYAARQQGARPTPAGTYCALCWVQENWELREVTAHCLRWVDRDHPPVEPVALDRREALPENLHPCGVLGDLLESPTVREEMQAPRVWPPGDLESLGSPESVGLVVPSVRRPAEREAEVAVARAQRAATRAASGPAGRTRSKRARPPEREVVEEPPEGGAAARAAPVGGTRSSVRRASRSEARPARPSSAEPPARRATRSEARATPFRSAEPPASREARAEATATPASAVEPQASQETLVEVAATPARAVGPPCSQETQPEASTEVAPTEPSRVAMTAETRRAVAAVLLQRPPISQEEADAVLARHGFGLEGARSPGAAARSPEAKPN